MKGIGGDFLMKKIFQANLMPAAVAVIFFLLGIVTAFLIAQNALKDYEDFSSEYKQGLEQNAEFGEENSIILKNQIADLQSKLDSAQKTKIELEAYASKLESELRALQVDAENNDQFYKDLKDELQLLNKNITDNASEIAALNTELENLEKIDQINLNTQYLIISNIEKLLKENAPMKKREYYAQTSSGTVITENGYIYPDISVYYEDLTYGFRYSWNGDKIYDSSSCIYVPFVCSVLRRDADETGEKIFDGNKIFTYTEDKILSADGIIKNAEFGTEYTYDELIRLVLRYNDAIAYEELKNEYGTEYLKNFISDIPVSAINKNLSNASVTDFGEIFKKIYSFINGGSEYSGVVKDELLSAINSQFISYGVSPKKTAHQSSCKKDAYHYMAIVYDEHPYVIVIMTNYSYESEEVNRYIQKISAVIDDLHESFYK